MSHIISLQLAAEMTARFREQKEPILESQFRGQVILPLSETFDAASFTSVLNQQGCIKLRIYYGMSKDLKIHAIIVGVNANDEDILPSDAQDSNNSGIIEEALRCPPICGPASPLNS